jgi:hypothetical protein
MAMHLDGSADDFSGEFVERGVDEHTDAPAERVPLQISRETSTPQSLFAVNAMDLGGELRTN